MDASTFARLRRNLIAWYAKSARDLPWRRTSDPYRIWISEIMLQQTTVVAVIPYFERFLARFPDVDSLAAAPEEDVLRLWEGLGYYSRARNIHKAARAVVAEHGGRFPDSVDGLTALPGIGRYTAGAIASFAFERRAPIVEANTLRLYARLLAYRDDPRSAAGQKTLWEFAETVLPQKSPGRFNQALMELGATVCTPTSPGCETCPLQSCCGAFAVNLQHVIPLPATRHEITDVTHVAVAVERDGQWLLRQCAPGERWAGLWDFPRVEIQQTVPARRRNGATVVPPSARMEIESGVGLLTGLAIEPGDAFHELKHSVTRYRIRLIALRGHIRAQAINTTDPSPINDSSPPGVLRWAKRDEMETIPLSMTGRKLANVLPAV